MRKKYSLIALACTTTAFAGGYVLHDHLGVPAAQATTAALSQERLTTTGSEVPLDFSEIAASQGPAVVNITVSGTAKASNLEFPGFEPGTPFPDFFRQFRIPAPNAQTPIHGQGSGFIVNSDGVVLTNAHVVADANAVTVRLTDKREFQAKVVGIDKQTDVAILRIDAKDLPTVKIGDPQKVKVGEWVLAIGAPFGFDNTVTAGIVSAKSRTLPDEGYVPFMQTDVAINPGNSGGPLFNTRGEVIGINSQIYTRSGGYQGLSFAIPIDVAMNIEKQLLDKGKVTRGRLGVTIQEVNQALADSFALDRPKGALVSAVEPDSPAARAGVQSGDVIVRYNGREVERSADLPALVAGTSPGSEASVGVWRQGKLKELRVTVGENNAVAAANPTSEDATTSSGKLGLVARPLKKGETPNLDVPGGLLVEDVADGPAARAGIQPGDVIVAVNGAAVATVKQLRDKVDQAGKNIALLVQRGERRIFVPIRIG